MNDYVSKCCSATILVFKKGTKKQYVCKNCNRLCKVKPRISKFSSDYIKIEEEEK